MNSRLNTLPLFFLSIFFCLNGCSTQNASEDVISLENPASSQSMYPRLFTDNTGTAFMSWMEQSGSMHSLKYASFGNDVWTEPQTIASDSTWFVNWADFPAIIAHNGNPLAAHWLNKVPGGTYAYHVNMNTFAGEWLDAFTPHNDDTPTEHGFLSMTPDTDSTFAALWLDGRQTHNRANDEYSDINKAMTLRAAFINRNGKVEKRFMIDDSVCDCCNTSIAKTKDGFIAAYRNRTADEIRDIYISRYRDGQWTEGKPIHPDNWEIAACPVNGPAVDTSGQTVAVAWYTGVDNQPKTKLAISKDGGVTFKTPILLNEDDGLGRIDLHLSDNNIWVSWLASDRSDDATLHINSYDYDGNKLSTHKLSSLSNGRSGGFPQITPTNSGLMIAYTDVSGDEPRVKTYMLD